MPIAVLFIVILLTLSFVAISIYNKIIVKKNHMQEAWSGVDVFLKKRYDLIPNFAEVVKGYARHEKSIFTEIAASRSMAMQAIGMRNQIQSELKMHRALTNLFVIVEKYPGLKANENFKQLQSQLLTLEADIEKARRYYNGTVRENNIYIESFPNNMLASMFNFEKGEFFVIEENNRDVSRVSF